MTARAVHQFVPTLAARDAIGTHTFQVQRVLWEMGLESEIFAGEVHAELSGRAHPYREFARRPGRDDTWLLYQASIGSPVADLFYDRPEPKLVNYHNLTPAYLLDGWEPHVSEEVSVGHHQLARMAGKVRAAFAVSRFNAHDLEEMGYERTTVVPPLIDLGSLESAADQATLDRLQERKENHGGADLLFVGRVLPHKAHHDLVKALAAYRQLYDPDARLHLVGAVGSSSYQRALEAFVAELRLEEAVELAGSVRKEELAAYYRSADAFVCCSDHEGFCFPLLEAMQHGVPVVAYAVTAVPETVGDAGLLLPSKSPLEVAAAVHRVVEDARLRRLLTRRGSERAQEYEPARTKARFEAAVRDALEAA